MTITFNLRVICLIALLCTVDSSEARVDSIGDLLGDDLARDNNAIYFTTLSATSATQRYYENVLQLALESSSEEYGEFELRRFPVPMDQSRQIRTIITGEADVMWTMSTPAREEVMLAVKFPLLKGLLGKRVFLVSKQKQEAFKDLSTQQLKQLTAVQGLSWPDTEVLRNNGFMVSAVAWYDWQFGISKLLTSNAVDYFPRSVMEAQAELTLPHNRDLAIEPHHMLEYPAHIYFFVNPKKPELQRRLMAGLEKSEANGSFEEIFKTYPSYSDAMKILNQRRRVHQLTRMSNGK